VDDYSLGHGGTHRITTGDPNMFKLHQLTLTYFLILFTGIFILTTPALAIHPDTKSETENLKRRIELLEAQQSESVTTEEEPAFGFGQVGKYLTLHGLLEVEAYFAKPNGGDEESDINLATAELSIETTLNDFIGGHLILLYEEDGENDDIDVDEAVISLRSPDQWFGQSPSLHVGRMYLPFGKFNSYMISDPLTLELGEIRNSAALFALEGEIWVLKVGAFNGDTDPDGDKNNIDSGVVSLDVAVGEKINVGGSYISDLAESDIELVPDASLYSSSVAAASAFLSARWGKFEFEAEYLTALEDFDFALVAVGEDLTGQRPEVWRMELAWMPSDRIQMATRYEQAKDFKDDVRRYGATGTYGLHEHVVVALEYLHADAKVDEDDPVNTITAQLVLEF
jgi:hypothetical protein